MINISDINGFSHKGVRENNEDYIIYSKDSILPTQTRVIVLCDGMGGHGHGEVASKIVAESVFETLSHSSKEFSADDLQYALDNAIISLNNADTYSDSRKMGTTLVVAVINNDNILVGHVGDSRCYLFDENCIKKFRTKDHSKVAEAVEAEILTEEEAFTSQYKNILTRSVMAGKMDVKIDVDRLEVDDKDRLFLCTDGVVDALRDEELAVILVDRNVDEALSMIDLECKIKSHDNYSAIIIDLHKEQNKDFSNVHQTKQPENSKERFSTPVEISQEEASCSELAYWKVKYHKKHLRRCGLYGLIGFTIALLLCGVSAIFISYQLDEKTKKKEFLWNQERINFYKYKFQTTIMIDSLCKQKTKEDTIILKKDLQTQYNIIITKFKYNNIIKK